MTLGDKRRRFTEAKALLIQYVQYRGWKAAEDYLKRCQECPVGDHDSVHKLGLAVDLNLYINGVYIRDERGHEELHDFWDLLGGAPRIDDDMNHYSFEHNGKW
jgi:hypothetical protein